MFGAVQAYQDMGSAPLTLCLRQQEETPSESLYPTVKGRRCTGIATPALEKGMGGGTEAMSVRAQDQDHDGVYFYFFAITSSPAPGSDACVHTAAHHATPPTPAALVGQQAWSGSLLK